MPTFYASVGPKLTRYSVDTGDGRLIERDTLRLPQNIQYARFDIERNWLYVACSDGSAFGPGSRHCLVAVDLAPDAMTIIGQPAPLTGRPIHLSKDACGRNMLVAYNQAPALSVHALTPDGAVGETLWSGLPGGGHYPHQIVPVPETNRFIVVCRGDDASNGRAENPGSLSVLSLDKNGVNAEQTVAPNGGYGFGPRNVALHPNGRWAYVSLERQSVLCAFAFDAGTFAQEPFCRHSSLDGTALKTQAAGTVRIHPNGNFLYMANRTHRTIGDETLEDAAGGQNSIAVFKIEAASGEPVLMQHIDSQGIHPRTLSIDSSGTLMIVGNVRPASFHHPIGTDNMPPSLTVYRIAADGSLTLLHNTPIETGQEVLFWSSFMCADNDPPCSHCD